MVVYPGGIFYSAQWHKSALVVRSLDIRRWGCNNLSLFLATKTKINHMSKNVFIFCQKKEEDKFNIWDTSMIYASILEAFIQIERKHVCI